MQAKDIIPCLHVFLWVYSFGCYIVILFGRIPIDRDVRADIHIGERSFLVKLKVKSIKNTPFTKVTCYNKVVNKHDAKPVKGYNTMNIEIRPIKDTDYERVSAVMNQVHKYGVKITFLKKVVHS